MKRLVIAGAALFMLRAALGCRPKGHAARAHRFGPPRVGSRRGRFAPGPVAV